jgi:uncharacterized protein
MDEIFGSFVWDTAKELENIVKHGIHFVEASQVFNDPKCLIILDNKHSRVESRLFCVGRVDNKILTVRFTYRGERIRLIGAGCWRKGERLYEKKNKSV